MGKPVACVESGLRKLSIAAQFASDVERERTGQGDATPRVNDSATCRHGDDDTAWAPNNDVTKPIWTNTRHWRGLESHLDSAAGRVSEAASRRHQPLHVPAALFDVNGLVHTTDRLAADAFAAATAAAGWMDSSYRRSSHQAVIWEIARGRVKPEHKGSRSGETIEASNSLRTSDPMSATSSIGSIDSPISSSITPHSFISSLIPSFSANPSYRRRLFLLRD